MIAIPSLYSFTACSPEWPIEFKKESTRLRSIFGGGIVKIHQIGSTSVPGLDAKPIIDLLPLVRDIKWIDRFTDRITTAGYKVWGEYSLPGRRLFTRDSDGYRTHNIHAYAFSDKEALRHIAFCAYLREHLDAQREYVAVKRTAYARYPADIDSYNDAKNDFIKNIEKVALSWF